MELAVQSRPVQTAIRELVGLVEQLDYKAATAPTAEKAALMAAAQDQALEQLGVLV